MNITKIAYTSLTAFVLVAAMFVAGKAYAQSEATVEALAVTCMSPEEAQEQVEGVFDTIVLSGKSGLSGYGVSVLFNRITGHYAILMLVSDSRVCIVDLGTGKSSVLRKFI